MDSHGARRATASAGHGCAGDGFLAESHVPLDEITFDNKDFFDINLLMDSVGREATGAADSQRLFEEKAKTDHQARSTPPC